MAPKTYLLALCAVTLTYWGTAVLGLTWSVVPGAGSAVWPASGVAFAALALFGVRLWPAVFLGRMLTFATVGASLPLWGKLLISLGTTAAAVLPILLLERGRRLDPRLGNMRDMLWIIAGGALAGACISAGTGTAVLLAVGTPTAQALAAGTNWFFGYGVGLLVLAPVLLTWWSVRTTGLSRASLAHLVLCVAVNAGAAAYVFLSPSEIYLRVWHLFPFLVWAAVAFQVRGAATALLAVSVFAVAGAILKMGPLATETASVQVSTLLTQQFIGMIGGTILLLAAAVDERRNVEAAARLAAIVRSSPEAMISYDARGRIQTWNKGAEILFGYPAEEVVGRGGEILLPQERPEGPAGVFGLARSAGEPIHIETVRMSREGKRIDVAVSASPMLEPGGAFLGVAAVMRDITERKKAELHQRLLIGELNHRVKNSLAVIQGLAQQTFKGISGAGDAKQAFEGRLMALAAAHDVLTKQKWESAAFHEIVSAALRPFVRMNEGRVSIEGPDFTVRPQAAVSLAMVLHELATNAVKYGALRPSGGRLDIRWHFEGEERDFWFRWMEQGAEDVEPPLKRSFGSRLIERTLRAELGASVDATYLKTGLSLLIKAPNFATDQSVPAAGYDNDLPLPLRAITVAS